MGARTLSKATIYVSCFVRLLVKPNQAKRRTIIRLTAQREMCVLWFFLCLKCYLSLVENQVRFMRSRCGFVFFHVVVIRYNWMWSVLVRFVVFFIVAAVVVLCCVVSFSLVKEDKIIIERSYRFFCCSVRILAELCLACVNLLHRPMFLHGTWQRSLLNTNQWSVVAISPAAATLCVCVLILSRGWLLARDVLFMLSGSICPEYQCP